MRTIVPVLLFALASPWAAAQAEPTAPVVLPQSYATAPEVPPKPQGQEPIAAPKPQAQEPAPADATSGIHFDAAEMARSARVSKLIGSKVYEGDNAIASIEDVLVDLNNGRITAIILSMGGFLGIGNKLVAVPVGAIQVSNEARFTTTFTAAELGKLPAFDYGRLAVALQRAKLAKL